jgi:amino acid transporter
MVAEILAITNLFKFRVDKEYLKQVGYPETSVQWFEEGHDPSPAVWIALAMPLMIILNLLPARLYGQIEYAISCIKITFFSVLICINVILAARQVGHPRFWTWQYPYGFGTTELRLPSPNTTVFQGAKGTFLAFWTGLNTSIFALMGWEITLITAPENKDLSKAETIKISSRKIGLRVTVLYALSIFTVGFIVPRDDKPLENWRWKARRAARTASSSWRL